MLRWQRVEGNRDFGDCPKLSFGQAQKFFFLARFCLPTGWSKLYGFSVTKEQVMAHITRKGR